MQVSARMARQGQVEKIMDDMYQLVNTYAVLEWNSSQIQIPLHALGNRRHVISVENNR